MSEHKHCGLGRCNKTYEGITCFPDGVVCEHYIPPPKTGPDIIIDPIQAQLKAQAAEIERLKKQLYEFWEHLDCSFGMEGRVELEQEAMSSWNPPNPLVVALHYIWKREPKVERLRGVLKQIEQTADSPALSRSEMIDLAKQALKATP